MRKYNKVISSTIIFLLSSSIILDFEIKANNEELSETIHIETNQETPFKDVNGSYWAYVPIMELVKSGYMEGYEDGTFKPNNYATRAEAASAIARSLNIPLDDDFQLKAKDLSPSHRYYKEIQTLAKIGVIDNSDYFRPEEPLTRAQIAKMLALAYDVEVDEVNYTSFEDIPDDFWAKHFVESLADVDIIQGTTDTTFSPYDYVTRAQLSVLVTRGIEFQKKIEGHQLAYDYLSKDYILTVNTSIEWTNEVVQLVNEEREKVGVQPLTHDVELTQLAIIKAQDMVKRNYFEHYSPYYGHPWDMATLFDYEFTRFGENIARNFNNPKDVVAAWMASETHRENMLRENYTNIGVGIKADVNGNYYWVQLFSSK
ncbi:MAG: S-layer protein [Lysinibacillus sp.]|nr:S-layer protein [Lysinibacillus sp.]